MRFLRGVERKQVMLLPAAVDDYVSAENPVRAIDAFVDGLSLEELGFVQPREADAPGAPGYDPGALLKLYVYGYLNRVRSSRELEKATRRNLEVIWLMRQLTPDHWTINAFRRAHRARFRQVFREFALICGSLGLFGTELVAIDGSHFQAVNSPRRNFTEAKIKALLKELDEKIEAYLKTLDTNDQKASAQGFDQAGKDAESLRAKLAQMEGERKRCAELLASLEQSPTGQISQTDPDSRTLKKGGQSVVGYNVQIAVDTAHHLVAAEQVTQEPCDWQMLAPMAVEAKENLQADQLRVVADAGYFSHEQLRQCAQAGIEPNVPNKSARPAGTGAYPLDDFRYDAQADCYVCPQGKVLQRRDDVVQRNVPYRRYYTKAACVDCPMLKQCTRGKFRSLQVAEGHRLATEVQARWKAQPELRKLRNQTVEHVFGTLKFWWGFRAFLCRGLQAVQAEFSLAALAYNFRRALNVVGVTAIVAAANS